MIKKVVSTALVVGALLSAVSVSASTEVFPGVSSPEVTKDLLKVKKATERYLDVDRAIKDGYEPEGPFLYIPGTGGMGIHYVNKKLMDGDVKQHKPEVLLYEPTADGGYKLVGVEYVVPAELTDEVPEIFSKQFDGPMPNHDGSEGYHYDLHVWIWETNPNGTFAQFNPVVTGNR